MPPGRHEEAFGDPVPRVGAGQVEPGFCLRRSGCWR